MRLVKELGVSDYMAGPIRSQSTCKRAFRYGRCRLRYCTCLAKDDALAKVAPAAFILQSHAGLPLISVWESEDHFVLSIG
jgi:hypothetical protein